MASSDTGYSLASGVAEAPVTTLTQDDFDLLKSQLATDGGLDLGSGPWGLVFTCSMSHPAEVLGAEPTLVPIGLVCANWRTRSRGDKTIRAIEIGKIFVIPGHRRRGIGRLLLDRLREEARISRTDVIEIALAPHEATPEVLGFLEGVGMGRRCVEVAGELWRGVPSAVAPMTVRALAVDEKTAGPA